MVPSTVSQCRQAITLRTLLQSNTPSLSPPGSAVIQHTTVSTTKPPVHLTQGCPIKEYKFNTVLLVCTDPTKRSVVFRHSKTIPFLLFTDFPLTLWDKLLPQIGLCLNHLHPYKPNPTVSSYACLHGGAIFEHIFYSFHYFIVSTDPHQNIGS